MTITTLSDQEIAFVGEAHAIKKLLFPPRKKGAVQEIQQRIKHLGESTLVSLSNDLRTQLELAAGEAKSLKDKNPIKRQEAREKTSLFLEKTIAVILPEKRLYDLDRNLSFYCFNDKNWKEKADKEWRQHKIPLEFLLKGSGSTNLLGDTAQKSGLEVTQWVLDHSNDVNYITTKPKFQPALFCAADLTYRMPLEHKPGTDQLAKPFVQLLLNSKADAMQRSLDGTWFISKMPMKDVSTSTLQLMMESVEDISLATGKVFSATQSRVSDALNELILNNRAPQDPFVQAAKIFISHGLRVPEALKFSQSVREKDERTYSFLKCWREFKGSQLILAEETYKKIHDEEHAPTNTSADCLQECAHFPQPLIGLIRNYLFLEKEIRIKISRRCLTVWEAQKG